MSGLDSEVILAATRSSALLQGRLVELDRPLVGKSCIIHIHAKCMIQINSSALPSEPDSSFVPKKQ